jgi:hypothetical protein
VPFFAAEVRHVHVCVLEVRDQHQVEVGDHVGDQVVGAHCEETCQSMRVSQVRECGGGRGHAPKL